MRLIDADELLNHTIFNPCHSPYITKLDVELAPTANGWISVDDDMPEDERHVLVWVKDGYSLIDWTFNGQWQVNPYMRNDITHWMPLPEAPKVGDNE